MGHVQKLIAAYLGGTLDETTRTELRRHCDGCPECARALAESRSVWEALARDEIAPAPEPAWPALAATLARRERSPARVLTPGFAIGATAVALAGLLLGGLIGGLSDWPWGRGGDGVADVESSAGAGGDVAASGGVAAEEAAASPFAALTTGSRLAEDSSEATLDGWLLALGDEEAAPAGEAGRGGSAP